MSDKGSLIAAIIVAILGVLTVGITVFSRQRQTPKLSLPDVNTWTCMVCGAERPDEAISVAQRPVAGTEDMHPAPWWNVRYCNDRDECRTAATAPGPWENSRRTT